MDAHAPNPMGSANLEWQSRVDSFGACLDTLVSNPILPDPDGEADDEPAASDLAGAVNARRVAA